MKKYILRNKLFLKMIVAFVLIGILGIAYNVKATVIKPELNIDASTSKSSIYVNEEFEVTYKVNPQPLALQDINQATEKEIILIVDTSGSMGDRITQTQTQTKIGALKNAAVQFIDKFKAEDRVKIGVVSYSDNAIQSKELVDADISSNQSSLISVINNLKAEGATNIGDGIRVAYKMFSSNSASKKYVILMSDGKPTSLTYSGFAGGYIIGKNGKYTYDYESSTESGKNYRLPDSLREGDRSWKYYGINDTSYFRYGTYGDEDPRGYCLKYSTLMASELLKAKIQNYVVNFSGTSNSIALNAISSAGGGTYYDAATESDIIELYSSIADKIKETYNVDGVKLNFTLPAGLQYFMNESDGVIDGNKYTKSIPSIEYKLDSNTNEYKANPINITLKFKGITPGNYNLSGDGWKISYKDISGNIINKLLPQTTINISKYNVGFDLLRKSIPENTSGKFNINNEFQIEYTIKPKPIAVQTTPKQKEIMLVVDKSGSMEWSANKDELPASGEKSRLKLTQEALNKFVEKFKDTNNVKIGLVTYDSSGEVYTNNNSNLFEYNNMQGIKNKINGLSAQGGTNLGDGLRRAAWALSSNTNSQKYIILMTDGEPTFYSYYYSNFSQKYYSELDNNNVYYNNDNDFARGLAYSKLIASKLRENENLGLKTFAIGFANDPNGLKVQKLKDISSLAGGEFYDATVNANAIEEVYLRIADQIKTDLAIENVKFTQQLPEGLVLSETGGTSITKDLKVNYTYNSTTKQYESEPISFTVKVKGTKVGNYELKDDAKLSYKDLDGTTSEKCFDPLNISILDTFIIKQGLFQPNGNNTNIIHVGEKNIKYISNLSLDITPNSEYQLATFVRTNGQETPINIKLNSSNNTEVTKMKIISVNVFSVNSDGSLTKLTSIAPIIENDSSASPNIKVTLNSENTSGDKYYIINYNYVVNEAKEDTNSMIINRSNIIGTDKFNDFNTKITAMPDVF